MRKNVISIVVLVALLVLAFAGGLFFNKNSQKPLTPREQQEQEIIKQLENKKFHKPVDLLLSDQVKIKSSCYDFFSSIAHYNIDELAKILKSRPEFKYCQDTESLKQYYGDIAEITIGEPFKIDAYPPCFYVPYKLRFKNGSIKEWQVVISYLYDNEKLSWYLVGGF